jgi:hypothetical protein
MTRCVALASVLACCLSFPVVADDSQFSAEDIEYFERKIRPLLSEHCYSCHSSQAKTIHGGLKLDNAIDLQTGGDSGPAIDVDSLQDSLFLSAVNYDDMEMPPKGKLSPAEIAEFTRWIKRGAPMPSGDHQPERKDEAIDFEQGRQFWSFQPAVERSVPAVRDGAWPRTRMDSFTLAAMEAEGLSPSLQADRAALIRRLSFDVIGLPPSPEEVQQFLADQSPDAYKKLLERLLQSPHYGEKWGRMWLDMARYTDKTASWLYPTGQSHLYRDWIVQAFNADLPFDEFVHRQLATDLIPETGPDDLPALGFISLSPTYWKELKLPCEIINTIVADEWEERVDAVSRTFLGLTVACARCHDHKFDPISSADYYALAGVFASCRQTERPIISEAEYEPVAKAKKQVAMLDAEITTLKKQKPLPKEKIEELTTQITSIKSSTALYDTPMTNALSEESMHVVRAGKTAQEGTRLDYQPEPRDLPLFIRGNANRPGPIVPRRFLTVLSPALDTAAAPEPFRNGSGRLELAHAITSEAASLTARVIVNRIWLAHFGSGLVATPSNFGEQGERPSHPELLDDLAARFIANGWSIKWLHREILLSATWQQSSELNKQEPTSDPGNRWLSRMNRQRLDFESWRDAILAASGVLDLLTGGQSIAVDSAKNHRRTIYSTVHRRDMSTTLTIHDFPDPTQHSPMRSSTTTPLQGLYALNGPLLTQQSDALVERLRKEVPDDNDEQIDRAYWLVYGRPPTEVELRLGREFVDDSRADNKLAAWQQYAHVLLASNELLFVD